MQAALTILRREVYPLREVVGEDCCCESGYQGCGGSEAGFVGLGDWDAEVVEARAGVEVGGRGVVVVVCKDGNGGGSDDGVS